MDSDRFDRLSRAAADPRTRRGVLRLLLGSALGMGSLAALNPGAADAAAAVDAAADATDVQSANAFGCLNVGQRCFGHDALCCSGRCAGKKPAPGRRDRRHCIAHNVGGCLDGQDFCAGTDVACGSIGMCFRTTGNAGFCGFAVFCEGCARDVECEARGHGEGAACVACAECPTTNFTACASRGV